MYSKRADAFYSCVTCNPLKLNACSSLSPYYEASLSRFSALTRHNASWPAVAAAARITCVFFHIKRLCSDLYDLMESLFDEFHADNSLNSLYSVNHMRLVTEPEEARL